LQHTWLLIGNSVGCGAVLTRRRNRGLWNRHRALEIVEHAVPHTATVVLRQKVPEQGLLHGQLFDARGHTIADQAH
jgi:hypothetical protein